MASWTNGPDYTFVAGASIVFTDSRYNALRVSGMDGTSAKVETTNSISSPVVGILQNNVEDTKLAEVRMWGLSKCRSAGAGITQGSLIRPRDGGGCEDVDGTSTERPFALAITSAAAGEIAQVLILGSGLAVP